jgi:hypothetical protein
MQVKSFNPPENEIPLSMPESNYNLSTLGTSTLNPNNNANNIYSCSSMHSVKYLIDINDLKQHLVSTNNLLSLNLANDNSNVKTSTAVSSKANLIDSANTQAESVKEDEQEVEKRTLKKIKRGKRRSSTVDTCCCCFRSCVGLFRCLTGCTRCISVCFFRPCCSMASTLFTFIALAVILVVVVCMGLVGIIQVPQEITRSICNATYERNNFYYHQNFTIIREIEKHNSSSKTSKSQIKIN